MSAPQYTTPQALIDAFGEPEMVELSDKAVPRANDVDLDVLQDRCQRATAEINAALAGRYALPLQTVPELLRYLALDLARFYLYDREPPLLVKTRFDAARETLRDLGTGRKALGADAAGASVRVLPADLAQLHGGAKDWARGTW